jgi:hypothetical protein
MAELAEVLENIRAEEADSRRLFGGESVGVRKSGRRNNPRYRSGLANAARFLSDVMEGRRPTHHLQEALTTSDFPFYFGDILDRQVLAAYREWPSVWNGIARRTTVNDFRPAKFYPPAWGADQRLDVVEEQGEYPEAKVNEQAAIQMSVKKYGRRIGFSWESIINDDLQQLRDIPVRFGRAARRSESRGVIEQYADANGPQATLYSNTNKNIINTTNGARTNNPTLSIDALQDAWVVLSKQTDENGEPIFLEMVTLVVPPALEVPARNIIQAEQIEVTAGAAGGSPNVQNTTATPTATGEQRLRVANWMKNNLRLMVDPYIPYTITGAKGNTSWFLFADPGQGRAAIQIAFLRNHEEPEIWIKEPDARRVGGGAVDPMEGDFDTDSIQYRVRHVFGLVQIDPKATVASNGSGT